MKYRYNSYRCLRQVNLAFINSSCRSLTLSLLHIYHFKRIFYLTTPFSL